MIDQIRDIAWQIFLQEVGLTKWVSSSTKETMYDRERWLNSAGTLRVFAAKMSWVLIWCEGAAIISGALARTRRNSCLQQYTTMKTESKKKTLTIANNLIALTFSQALES